MTQTVSKHIAIIGRAEFKINHLVLYGVRSGEKVYEVSVMQGKVTGCKERGGEECRGFHFGGHCRHTDLVQVLEWEHRDKAELRFNPWHGSNPSTEVERPLDERGTLNGDHRFSLLR